MMDFTSEIITQLSQFLKSFSHKKNSLRCMIYGTLEPAKYTQQGGICMDFKDLEYFAAIAGAATSPARPSSSTSASLPLSKFLQKLEGDTGLVLFQRAGRRAGADLCGPAVSGPRRAAAQPEAGDGRGADRPAPGRHRCAACGHAAVPVRFSLPEVLPAFRAQFPQVSSAEEAPSAELDRKRWKARSTWPFI